MIKREQTIIKYVDLEGYGIGAELIKQYVDRKDEASLKTAILDEENGILNLYTTEQPISEDAVPAFAIELPKTDLSALMHKLVNATKGNVVTVGENGEVTDGGIALADLATQDWVGTTIAEEIGKTTHLTAQVVAEIPEAGSAKANVIYMVKDETVTSGDSYKEYMLINGQIECIGSTETDLSDYYTKDAVDGKIDAAQTKAYEDAVAEAAKDATSKADAALEAAKAYADQEVKKVDDKVTANTEDIATLKTDVETLEETATQHTDRIAALENSMSEINTATEDDIKDLFKTILV